MFRVSEYLGNLRYHNLMSWLIYCTGYKDIGYSFLVGQDARIYEGRGWGVVGGHTEGNNTDAYGVAFIGDYRTSLPERAALKGIVHVPYYCANMPLRRRQL